MASVNTTGDLSNNLRKLTKELKKIRFNVDDLDWTAVQAGLPQALLPIFQYLFVAYDASLYNRISEMNITLTSKTDAVFMSSVYKIMRDVLRFKPTLTVKQFFSRGFIEQKVILCLDTLGNYHAWTRASKLVTNTVSAPALRPSSALSTRSPRLATSSLREVASPSVEAESEVAPAVESLPSPVLREEESVLQEPNEESPSQTDIKTYWQKKKATPRIDAIEERLRQAEARELVYLDREHAQTERIIELENSVDKRISKMERALDSVKLPVEQFHTAELVSVLDATTLEARLTLIESQLEINSQALREPLEPALDLSRTNVPTAESECNEPVLLEDLDSEVAAYNVQQPPLEPLRAEARTDSGIDERVEVPSSGADQMYIGDFEADSERFAPEEVNPACESEQAGDAVHEDPKSQANRLSKMLDDTEEMLTKAIANGE